MIIVPPNLKIFLSHEEVEKTKVKGNRLRKTLTKWMESGASEDRNKPMRASHLAGGKCWEGTATAVDDEAKEMASYMSKSLK